ncbi:MAG: hypothetical protein GY847_25340 [Proteobacteria bacterium]|nr:hypothetical protein [Pseudomonadota bacterium]
MVNVSDRIVALRRYLITIQPGHISDPDRVVELLIQCWKDFEGRDETKMEEHKLGRAEEVEWKPPILGFIVERHGGTVMGSSRAELQRWFVNIEERTAYCGESSYRQLSPRQAPLNAKKLATDIASLVTTKDRRTEYLKWFDDGTVRVIVGKILPEGSAVKQTLIGRRKRFRKELREVLKESGWEEFKLHRYEMSPRGS